MSLDRAFRSALPDSARQNLDDFAGSLALELRLWSSSNGDAPECLYPGVGAEPLTGAVVRREISARDGNRYTLELVAPPTAPDAEALADVVAPVLERTLDFAKEIRFFTLELSERYEEINLLYSISETLGSTLQLEDAARLILVELCDVLGARRGSLWVHDPAQETLVLTASVGEGGRREPIGIDDVDAVTAQVFRENRSVILSAREVLKAGDLVDVDLADSESFLLVPVSYTPPSGAPRTVGVINLIGRHHGGRFTAADQKLLAAIASQVGAALENNRLIRQSLARERMAREMELAHDLQQKLLPSVDGFPGARVSARVE
ncbi:MAG: GAF domain-containing protein, partial [Gemmatimonadota bacterium]